MIYIKDDVWAILKRVLIAANTGLWLLLISDTSS